MHTLLIGAQSVPIEEQLDTLGECISAGKIRSVGLSNETAWGLMKFVAEGMVLDNFDTMIVLLGALTNIDSFIFSRVQYATQKAL